MLARSHGCRPMVGGRRSGGDHLLRQLLCTTALTSAAFLAPEMVLANPQGGALVGGSANISQAPGVTTVDQASRRAVINWRSFDIAPGELTRFNQPSKEAIALNRVTGGGGASAINGRLEANGNVWVTNPAGVLIGPSAKVDTHGFLATTADIRDADFMAGRNDFSIPSPQPEAAVVNQGTITVDEAGLAGLVAPHVRNDGIISARLGTVVLAGAPTFTVDFQGDGLISFAATSAVTGNDPTRALIENHGRISADGGRVLLTATTAAGVVDRAINTDGVVEARSIAMRDGAIVLDGGDGGGVAVAGALDAGGARPGEKGGTVKVLGETVALTDGAAVNVSGQAGGGTALIGGNFQGKGPERNAKRTSVAKKATIRADADSAGDGGRIIVWGDEATLFAGTLSAGGGPQSGNGGFAEVSGRYLAYEGSADLRAATGSTGTLLLDPYNVTIVADGYGGSIASSIAPDGWTFRTFAADAVLTVGTLRNALNKANVIVSTESASPPPESVSPPIEPIQLYSVRQALDSESQAGNITVAAQINGPANANNLTLLAHNDIVLNAPINMTAGTGVLTLHADAIAPNGVGEIRGSGRVYAPSGGTALIAGDGINVSVGGTTRVAARTASGNIYIIDGSGGWTVTSIGPVAGISTPGDVDISGYGGRLDANISASSIHIFITPYGTVQQNAAAKLIANSLSISGSETATGSATLLGQNNVQRLTVNAPLHDFAFKNMGDLEVPASEIGSVTARTVKLDVAGRLTLNDPITATAGETSILVHANALTNNVGANALQPGAGRYLVYSTNPANDTRNVPSDQFSKRYNVPYNAASPDGGLPATGNYFLYSIAPTLTLKAADQARPYGDPNPAPLPATVVGGLIDGDTVEQALPTIPLGTTTAVADSPVSGSPYPITVDVGDLLSPLGYTIEGQDGGLTVTKAPLTTTVQNLTRVYGSDTQPQIAVTGFKFGGETASLVSGLALDPIPGPGLGVVGSPYTISTTGGVADNYAIAERIPGPLTVTPAPFTITALDAQRRERAADPPFDYTYQGLVNSEPLSAALSGFALTTPAQFKSPAGAYSIDVIGGSEGPNYAVTRVPGELTVTAVQDVFPNPALVQTGGEFPEAAAVFTTPQAPPGTVAVAPVRRAQMAQDDLFALDGNKELWRK